MCRKTNSVCAEQSLIFIRLLQLFKDNRTQMFLDCWKRRLKRLNSIPRFLRLVRQHRQLSCIPVTHETHLFILPVRVYPLSNVDVFRCHSDGYVHNVSMYVWTVASLIDSAVWVRSITRSLMSRNQQINILLVFIVNRHCSLGARGLPWEYSHKPNTQKTRKHLKKRWPPKPRTS